MNNRTSKTKELLWYKLPTCIIDLCIYFTILSALVSKAEFIFVFNKSFIFSPLPVLIVLSYFVAISIIPIKLNNRKVSYWHVLIRAVCQVLLTIIFFCGIVYFTYSAFDVRFYIILASIAICAISLWHLIVKLIINILRVRGKNLRQVVIIGNDENAITLYNSIKHGYGLYGYNILGFFTDRSPKSLPNDAKYLGRANDVVDYLLEHSIHEVYCCVNPALDAQYVNKVIRVCENNFITFYYLPSMDGYIRRKMTFEEFGNVNVMRLREEPLQNPASRLAKRLFDILVSGLFLVTVFPFAFLFAAVGIKLSSPGPIFFRQARTGYKGDAFKMFKFRTMHVNADCDKLQATQDDPRKFKFGDFLRRTSIDELPQFINIFLGDMSLIGPRPHMEYHTEMYSKLIDEYLVRHLVKPGLSGWAQVNGCRGETKTVDQMEQRVIHDIWYIEHWTIGLDIKIIFMTIWQVLAGDKQAY